MNLCFLPTNSRCMFFMPFTKTRPGATILANRRETTADRLVAALAGSRNDGQSFLEVAVAGPETPEAAQNCTANRVGKNHRGPNREFSLN